MSFCAQRRGPSGRIYVVAVIREAVLQCPKEKRRGGNIMNSGNSSAVFPDGTRMDPWFQDAHPIELDEMGRPYDLREYGIVPDGTVQTQSIQGLIDRAASEGGGVIVVPEGEFITGALYFHPGVNLYVTRNGVLKGSSDILDYPLCPTRIEGQSVLYFPALINVLGVHGFKMAGEGCIDGNGLHFWQSFWLRRQWNPQCTNKDEQRPRLIFLSHCTDVTVSGLTFRNAAFWTNHLYKCQRVKYLNCRMLSPHEPVGAPSTDALDIDACEDVLVKNCEMAVNDDAVALKGGKGPWADTTEENGSNERILIEDCRFGFCHGCLTVGSECVHARNVIMRNIRVETGYNLLWLKFRPDTPQKYEFIRVENVRGKCANFLNINPWSQFFDLQGRTDLPVSVGRDIELTGCDFECDTFFNVHPDEAHFHLERLTLRDLHIRASNPDWDAAQMDDLQMISVTVEKKEGIDYPDSVTTLTADNTVCHH